MWSMKPPAASASLTAVRATSRSSPANSPPFSLTSASMVKMLMASRSWRLPISKSFGSWAGVTLTAPVPNSGSTTVVGHHRDLPVHERKHDRLADGVGVALVVGVDGDAGVAQHRLGPGGGHRQVPGAVGEGVVDVDELAGSVLVLDLDVRQGGVVLRAPVDDAIAPVDEVLLVEADEDLANCGR